MWKHGGIAGSHRVMLSVLQVCRSGSGNNAPNLSTPVFLSAGGHPQTARFHHLCGFIWKPTSSEMDQLCPPPSHEVSESLGQPRTVPCAGSILSPSEGPSAASAIIPCSCRGSRLSSFPVLVIFLFLVFALASISTGPQREPWWTAALQHRAHS